MFSVLKVMNFLHIILFLAVALFLNKVENFMTFDSGKNEPDYYELLCNLRKSGRCSTIINISDRPKSTSPGNDILFTDF